MTYTTEQIADMLGKITPGEWKPFDYEEFEGEGITPEGLRGYWLDGPAFIQYDVYSLFTEADAEFIAAAPEIVRQQAERVEALEAVILHIGYERRGRAGETIICRECKQLAHGIRPAPSMTDIDHAEGCVTGEIGRKSYEQARQALGGDS
jgi:hypothetical protein